MKNEKIDQTFLAAARIGDADEGQRLLRDGADVNARDPISGLSALHYAAGAGAHPFIELLESTPDLDYLATDRKNRLPSALAFEVANDRDLGLYLAEKEVDQAGQKTLSYPGILAGRIPV